MNILPFKMCFFAALRLFESESDAAVSVPVQWLALFLAVQEQRVEMLK